MGIANSPFLRNIIMINGRMQQLSRDPALFFFTYNMYFSIFVNYNDCTG